VTCQPVKEKKMGKTLLVIDDDVKLLERLKKYLERFDFQIFTESSPLSGIEIIGNQPVDLVILDVMLPEIDGFEALRRIRKTYGNMPVIMLTARGEVTDRIVGLEIGADDYLPKPFEPRELVARINLNSHQVTVKNEEIILTNLEFQLLKVFMENAGRVLDRNFLLDGLKGMDWETFDRSIDVLISRLRNKIKDTPRNSRYIKTIWGTGYMFLKGDG
jgi:DNA-binding response OmpR family regulator